MDDYQEAQVESRTYLEVINDFALAILQYNSVDEVLWGVSKHVISRLGFEDFVIYLLDEDKKNLIQRAAFGPKNPIGTLIKDAIKIPVGQGITGAVALNKLGELISDTSVDDRYILDDQARLSEICVPIIYQEELIGVLDSEHSQRNFFTQEHFQILTTIASMLAVKISRLQVRSLLRESRDELIRANQELKEEIEERKKTEIELKGMNEELNTFIYKTSHDIRGPLTSIMGLVEIARWESNQPGLLEYFVQLNDRLKHLDSVLLELINVTRVKEWVIERKQIDFENLLSDIVQSIRHVPLFDKVHIEQEIHQEHPFFSDWQILHTILHNLTVNAIKYCHPQRLFPYFRIEVRSDENGLTIRAEDNGIGIPEDAQNQVFNMFYRGTRISEGVGLGLYLVHKSVQKLGGRIDFESKEGEGTIFKVQLPNLDQDSPE